MTRLYLLTSQLCASTARAYGRMGVVRPRVWMFGDVIAGGRAP